MILSALADVGLNAQGGYDRFAWSRADAECREWFVEEAVAIGLDVEQDRNGNLWAWLGAGLPGKALVVGSHLDSVPNGGAYDGPLGVASALAALSTLTAEGFTPSRPIAVVVFADEEGARFGVACVGSRLMVGALAGDRAAALTDGDGVTMAEASGLSLGAEPSRVDRIGEFIELHIEQGRLPWARGHGLDVPVGIATEIWPHGRWRVDIDGRQDHAGTTPLDGRDDPMLGLANLILDVRAAATRENALATVGKVHVHPGAVNAIPGQATAWIDARAADEARVRRVMHGFDAIEESWTAVTRFSSDILDALGDVPHLPSGAGHDAGVLALAGIPSAMILVRNPTGISHSPLEHADDDDILAGIDALVTVIRARA